jgi:hypothetical protein
MRCTAPNDRICLRARQLCGYLQPMRTGRQAGYHEFGRHTRYYEDGGDALRFEKRIAPSPAASVMEDVE